MIEQRQERKRASHWKQFYGVTPEEVWARFREQEGRCAISTCRQPISLEIGSHPRDRAHVDHCHETGRFRGLLCVRCNTGLGHYERQGEAFAEYLELTGLVIVDGDE